MLARLIQSRARLSRFHIILLLICITGLNLSCLILARIGYFRDFSTVNQNRIALLLAGELRTLSDLEVRQSLLRSIVGPLNPETFLHVSDSHGYTWQRSKYVGIDNFTATNASELFDITTALRPVNMSVFRNVTDDGERQVPMRHLLIRWKLLLDMMIAREDTAGRMYDWVIRARPDLVYECSFARFRYEDSSITRVFHQWDFFAVAPRHVAPIVLNLLFEADQFQPCFVYQPELCLAAVLWKHRIPLYNMRASSIFRPKECQLHATNVSCNSGITIPTESDLQECVWNMKPVNFTKASASWVLPIFHRNLSLWASQQLERSRAW